MKKILALAGAALLVTLNATAADKLKVVYHVDEYERVPFVLNNIENHIKGVGGPENVEIILVAHGPALKAFEKKNADPSLLERYGSLQKKGVEFDACGNTLKKESLGIADLPEGFVKLDEGGVVRLAELQHEGYIYIRP
ncbi:MAG TPA: DsrE family protein [Rhodocyclaceae bacterium]|nr:DsrE family protein [Rhodocyclaceae bacterium]